MKIFKKAIFILVVFIVGCQSKLKERLQYYSKATYPYDTCNVKYDSTNHTLILYSGENIDTLLMQKNEKIRIESWKNNNDPSANKDNLLINGKSVRIKKGLDGFWNHKEKFDIKKTSPSFHGSSSMHYSHRSHASHFSSN